MFIVLWLLAAYITMSAVEYVIHRYFMHRRVFQGFFERHAALHHGYYSRTFSNAADKAAKHIGISSEPLQSLIGLSFIWLPLLLLNRTGGIVFIAFITLHGFVWTAFHFEMHEPKGRWFAETRYFKWVRNYHYAHHLNTKRNFTALCPLFDQILGTYMRAV